MLHKPDRTGTLDQREEGRDLTARRTTGTGSAQDQTLPTGRQCDSCSYMREGMIRITEGWISQDGHASYSHSRSRRWRRRSQSTRASPSGPPSSSCCLRSSSRGRPRRARPVRSKIRLGMADRSSKRDGQRTVNWNALTRRMVSSTERPTGRSLTVICLDAITAHQTLSMR